MDKKNRISLNEAELNLDFMDFQEENPDAELQVLKKIPYKVMISDDDEEIHRMTKLVLKGFEMEGAGLFFIDAYSEKETVALLQEHPDTAIILLDVVMEDNESGLRVVKYMREVLKNNLTRIILRTGQPGIAPEEKVIVDYEIDDYKSKAELTVQKLISTMYVCLRAHKNIKALDRHKEGLHRVITASQDLFKYHSFTEFLNGMLNQVIALYDVEVSSFYVRDEKFALNGMAFIKIMDSAQILAGTGKYEKLIGQSLDLTKASPSLRKLVQYFEQSNEPELVVREGNYLGIYKQNLDKMVKNYIVLEADVSNDNIELIKLFLTNFSLAIDNFVLNMNANETQKEIIFRISEVVENRSDSTANHLKRVSKISECLAEKLGYDKDMVMAIALASVMHDVGKIGISDAILLKPGKLTEEEFEIMKQHTVIGNRILKDSKLPVLNLAANIALFHHEKYDGNGYPEGRVGEAIPRESAIVAVADVFDALLSNRCYKKAWSFEDTIAYMEKEKGKHFSPLVVDTLMENIGEIYEIVLSYPDED